jgi:hypothetical protein
VPAGCVSPLPARDSPLAELSGGVSAASASRCSRSVARAIPQPANTSEPNSSNQKPA